MGAGSRPSSGGSWTNFLPWADAPSLSLPACRLLDNLSGFSPDGGSTVPSAIPGKQRVALETLLSSAVSALAQSDDGVPALPDNEAEELLFCCISCAFPGKLHAQRSHISVAASPHCCCLLQKWTRRLSRASLMAMPFQPTAVTSLNAALIQVLPLVFRCQL